MKRGLANCANPIVYRQSGKIDNEKAERAWSFTVPKSASGIGRKIKSQIETRSSMADSIWWRKKIAAESPPIRLWKRLMALAA